MSPFSRCLQGERDLCTLQPVCRAEACPVAPHPIPHIAPHLDTDGWRSRVLCIAGSPQLAAMSSALVWELVKHNNAFIHKGLNGAIFSREAGNL